MSDARCALCGEPMPSGEEMFKYHGYSGGCPKLPLPVTTTEVERILSMSEEQLTAELAKDGETLESAAVKARAIFERAYAQIDARHPS